MSARLERLHHPAFVALCKNDLRILWEYNRSILFTKIIVLAVFFGLISILHWLCQNDTLETLLYFPAAVFILLTLGFIIWFKHIARQSAPGHWIRQRWIFRLRGTGCHSLSSKDRGESDPWQTDRLCPLCKRLVDTSWLLYGSPWILGPAREQHKFHQSFSGVNSTAGRCVTYAQSFGKALTRRFAREPLRRKKNLCGLPLKMMSRLHHESP
jgi:hypothetical protein